MPLLLFFFIGGILLYFFDFIIVHVFNFLALNFTIFIQIIIWPFCLFFLFTLKFFYVTKKKKKKKKKKKFYFYKVFHLFLLNLLIKLHFLNVLLFLHIIINLVVMNGILIKNYRHFLVFNLAYFSFWLRIILVSDLQIPFFLNYINTSCDFGFLHLDFSK